MNRPIILAIILLSAIISIATGCDGATTEVNALTFAQLLSNPDKYNGKTIAIEGFCFHGWEIIVLGEKLEHSGYAPGHLIQEIRDAKQYLQNPFIAFYMVESLDILLHCISGSATRYPTEDQAWNAAMDLSRLDSLASSFVTYFTAMDLTITKGSNSIVAATLICLKTAEVLH